MDVNKKNIELFDNKNSSLGEIRHTPFVGLINGIDDVLYASKKSFGSTIKIEDNGEFIKPVALNKFIISSQNDTILHANASAFKGVINDDAFSDYNYNFIYADIYTQETINCDAIIYNTSYSDAYYISEKNITKNYLFRNEEKDFTDNGAHFYAFDGYYGTFYTEAENGYEINAYVLHSDGGLADVGYIMDIIPTKITFRKFKLKGYNFDIYLNEKDISSGSIYTNSSNNQNQTLYIIPYYIKDNGYFVYSGNVASPDFHINKIGNKPYTEIKIKGGKNIEYIVSEDIDCLESNLTYQYIRTVYDSTEYYNNYITAISIPGCVNKIGDKCFYLNNNLTSVVLNEGIKEIGSSAFQNCSSLSSISIPNSIETIGDSAFYYLNTNITIPDSNNLKNIGTSSFYNTTINDGTLVLNNVEKIETAAFIYTNLTSITIGPKIKEIGSSAFTNMSYNFDVYILSQNPPSIQGTVFDYNRTQHIYVPDEYLQNYLNSDFDSSKIYPISESNQ